MITESELMTLKCRMLVAADAAGRVTEKSQEDVVLYNEDEYAEVSEALRLLSSDLGVVFGELDTLRMLVRREFSAIFAAPKPAEKKQQSLATMVVEVAKSLVKEAPEVLESVLVTEDAVVEPAVELPIKKKRGRPRKVVTDDNAIS